jgi:hypothetical protein
MVPWPQLRGILLCPDKPADEAVQYGWHPCIGKSGESVRMVFARNVQEEPYPPAVLPPLLSLGLYLWRRTGSHAALAVAGNHPAEA